MKRFTAMLCALCAPFCVSHAALLSVETPLGENTGVVDTVSGLEWLKLSTTVGETINQVYAGMAPGGLLSGFRYATENELQCTLLAPQIGLGCGDGIAVRDATPVQAFLMLFGASFPTNAYAQADPPTLPADQRTVFTNGFFSFPGQAFPAEFDFQRTNLSADLLNRAGQHWLVSRNSGTPGLVAEPETTALILLGAAALLSRRKSRPTTKQP